MSKKEMKYATYPIYFWGICDALVASFLFLGWLSNGEMPFLGHINLLFETLHEPLDSLSLLTTSILFLIETSIFFSAFFLIRLKKIGVYFVYFQAPLRLFINYSSVPLLMELVVVYGNVNVGVILFIETIKLATVFYWHIYSLNRETFKEAIRGYLDFLFKTNTIIASFLLFALLKTLIYSILYSENAPMLYGNIASFFINSILAFFAFKRNTIALSFFCISLFLLNALNLIWLLSNPEKYSFFVFLFMLLDLYFIIGAVTITQQIKQKRIEIIKT